jgi:arginine deiminase
MIGMGERTTPQAVIWIARSLFRSNATRPSDSIES